LEQEEVEIEAILPEACQKAENVAKLLEEIENADNFFEQMRADAAKEGKVLRFIAKLENGKASINLQKVDNTNPFHGLSGSDNMIVFTTERYKERPLVIRGPGAGAEVTAAGVFAEIITIGNFLS
jgi:aspartokinase/homoserine dehydrogenase 1